MASSRRVLNDDELEELLNRSDVEPDDPYCAGDDDIDDCDYFQQPSSSSDDETRSSDDETRSTDDETNRILPISRQNRGRGRSRRRIGARRPRGSRSGRHNSRQSLQLTFEESTSNQLPGEKNEWSDCEFVPDIVPFVEPASLPVDRSSYAKIDYFRQYIDDDVISNIVDKSNRSYLARTGKTLNLTYAECNSYIAITMMMTVINYPTLRMFWSKKFRVPFIANNMSRNRFLILRNSIKLVLDEDVSDEERRKDKLWKVRPIINAVLKGCKMQEKTKDMSIDEMIIPFQGICVFKQYCPGKPNPVGLKVIVLANSNGLVCDFDVYQGTTTYPDYDNTDFGLGEKAVLRLTENLIPGHVIYCDRYFTSEKLILTLRSKGIMCVGTLMKNRIPRPARSIVEEDKIMKKKTRGTWQVVVHKTKKIAITKWLDSKPVTLMSNIYADQTIDSCERWSKKENKYNTIPRPEVVKKYNANMGGVDMADRMLTVCPSRYRTRKWTQRFISHMIDLAVSNSWILYRNDELNKGIRLKKIQQLRSFKWELAEFIIDANFDTETDDSSHDEATPASSESSSSQLSFRKRKVPVPLPSETHRIRGAIMHLPAIGEIQHKCRQAKCNKKTKIRCMRCNIYLCLTKERNCFASFHNWCNSET